MSARRLFRLRNSTSDVVRLSWGEAIAGNSVGEELYSVTHIAKNWKELSTLGVAVTDADPPFPDADLDALLRELGLLSEGQSLRGFPSVPRARQEKTRSVSQRDRYAYMTGRLHGVVDTSIAREDLEHATLVVIMSRLWCQQVPRSCGVLDWPLPEDMDVGAFNGIVRLIASTMGGKNQRVLLVGQVDSIETIAACALREYLGCVPEIAIGMVRACRRKGLNKSELLETVFRYHPS